jgi:hypothetical protein
MASLKRSEKAVYAAEGCISPLTCTVRFGELGLLVAMPSLPCLVASCARAAREPKGMRLSFSNESQHRCTEVFAVSLSVVPHYLVDDSSYSLLFLQKGDVNPD